MAQTIGAVGMWCVLASVASLKAYIIIFIFFFIIYFLKKKVVTLTTTLQAVGVRPTTNSPQTGHIFSQPTTISSPYIKVLRKIGDKRTKAVISVLTN